MNSPDMHNQSLPSEIQTSFAARAPSQSWEMVALSDAVPSSVWMWFKPATVPAGVFVRVPEDASQDGGDSTPLTLRKLIQAAAVEVNSVSTCYLYGIPYDAAGGTAAILDQALPKPPAAADPNIVICTAALPREPVQQITAPQTPVSTAKTGDQAANFSRIEEDWRACLLMEKQLTTLRKQLAAMLNRLKSLNRDLNPDEQCHSDRLDRSDWQAARRWMRDLSSRLTKFIKEHDIGETSSAGKKQQFQQMYAQFIAPRVSFDGIEQAEREFVYYRKRLQTLANNMNAAHSNASSNGEQRAQQILRRIAGKVRDARTKRRNP
jgi:hypothetical protein